MSEVSHIRERKNFAEEGDRRIWNLRYLKTDTVKETIKKHSSKRRRFGYLHPQGVPK